MSLEALKGGIEVGRRKKPSEVKEVVEEVVEPVVDEVVEEEPVIEEQPIVEKKGKVTALKLYLRSEPSTESEPLKTLDRDTLVTINDAFVDSKFYKVALNDGLEGYCVKEFIEIIE